MARRVLIVILILAVAAAALILAPIEFAAAQRGGFFGQPSAPAPPSPVGGFFNFLFGPLQTQPRPPPQPVRPRAVAPAPRQQPQAAAPPPVAKDPMARKVLVVGDFVGSVLAAGLDQAFADEPRLRVVDRTNSDSGLARQDYYDWVRAIPAILASEHPDIAVVVLGANDRQTLSGIPAIAWGTTDWDTAYSGRVAAFDAAFEAYGAPFLWVSTVPMRSTPEPDMAHINDLSAAPAAAAGGTFVDVWEGFADDDGRLMVSGPDVNGQTAQLRTGNGINFTAAGQEKLAFYVAKEIRRVTGIDPGGAAPDLVAGLGQGSHFEVGPDGQRRLVGPVISLTDPAPGSATALAGDPNPASASPLLAAPADPASPQALLVQGATLPVVRGRTDDFTWPRPAP